MSRYSRERGAPCHAHDKCECGRPICVDCPDVIEACPCHEEQAA